MEPWFDASLFFPGRQFLAPVPKHLLLTCALPSSPVGIKRWKRE